MYSLIWNSGARISKVSMVIAGVIIAGCAGMAYAAVSSGAFTAASSTQVNVTRVVVTKPATAVGDVMLAAVAVNGGSAAVVTAPGGWTLVQRTDNDVNLSLITYYKIATASEPVSYTWSIDGQTTGEGTITAYTGIKLDTVVDAVSSATGFGTSATAAPVTTTFAGDKLVTIFSTDIGKITNAGAYFSTAVNATEKYDVTNTPFGPSMAADESVQESAGVSTTFSSSISGGKPRNWAAQTIALVKEPKIVFDSAAKIHWQDPTTINFTVGTDPQRSLVVCEYTTNDTALPPTYNGVPLSLVGKSSYRGFANLGVAAYVMTNPPSGTHLLTFNTSAPEVAGFAASYSGVDQANPIDGFSSSGVSASNTITDSVITTSTGSWLVMCPSSSQASVSYTSSGPVRSLDSTLAGVITDSGAPVPVGLNAFSVTDNTPATPGFIDDVLVGLRMAQ